MLRLNSTAPYALLHASFQSYLAKGKHHLLGTNVYFFFFFEPFSFLFDIIFDYLFKISSVLFVVFQVFVRMTCFLINGFLFIPARTCKSPPFSSKTSHNAAVSSLEQHCYKIKKITFSPLHSANLFKSLLKHLKQ